MALVASAVHAIYYTLSHQDNEELSIHFLELGNAYTGDCSLIKVGDTEVLIDAGSKTSSVPTIQAYLNEYVTDGIIEYVVVTHAHEDHIAGFATPENKASLFDLYQVNTVIQFVKTEKDPSTGIYKNYLRELSELQERCATQVYNALECLNEESGAKKVYNLSKTVKLEILDQKYYHPEFTAGNENDNSVCCQVIQNDSKYYLFTGDLEKSGEESLVERNNLHPVELYKAGHHGSKTSSSEKLMQVIKPKHVCVCCCAGSSEYTSVNENQFPTQTFINNVAPYTDKVYVTTLCIDFKADPKTFTLMNGNIVIYSKGNEIQVKCSNNDIVLKDTEWFKANRNLPSSWTA